MIEVRNIVLPDKDELKSVNQLSQDLNAAYWLISSIRTSLRISKNELSIDGIRDHLDDKEGVSLLGAFSGVNVLGAVQVTDYPIPTSNDTLAIDYLVVCETQRKKGIGRLLVNHVLATACREDGTNRKVKLCSVPSATGFYQKLGFRPENPSGVSTQNGYTLMVHG